MGDPASSKTGRILQTALRLLAGTGLVGIGASRAGWEQAGREHIRGDVHVALALGQVHVVEGPSLIEEAEGGRLQSRYRVVGDRGTRDVDLWMERSEDAWTLVRIRIASVDERSSGTYRGGRLVDAED